MLKEGRGVNAMEACKYLANINQSMHRECLSNSLQVKNSNAMQKNLMLHGKQPKWLNLEEDSIAVSSP